VNPPATLPLDPERFRALLEAYGSRFASWPASERAGAEALLLQSAEARGWVVEHARLDAWLDSAISIEPSASLLRRVAEIPLRHPSRSFWARLRPRNALAALSAAAMMGVVTGLAAPDPWFDGGSGVTDEDDAMTWNGDLGDEVAP
jgi:hypothetical protein